MSLQGDAIFNTHASVVTVRDDKGYDSSDNEVTLDDAAVTTELDRLQTDFDGKAYQRTRAAAYPTIGDQLDMLWHAVDTGDWTAAKVKTTEFYTALKAVKDANPKP